MPPIILDLIKDFLEPQNESLRGSILKNHVVGLGSAGYKLSQPEVDALGTMELGEVVPELIAKLSNQQLIDIKDCWKLPTQKEQVACILQYAASGHPFQREVRTADRRFREEIYRDVHALSRKYGDGW